ncbi:3'-5' exonuclease [Endozoicomonadaceae bacterium StTr2]
MNSPVLEKLRFSWLNLTAGRSHADFSRFFPAAPANEYISLDLETSSLDPDTNEILEIAAIPIRDGRIYPGEALVLRLQPEGELNPDSVPVHRIREKDLERAMLPKEALIRLLTFIGRRPLVGYNIRFDQHILSRYCRKYFGFNLPNSIIELSHCYYRKKLQTQPESTTDMRFEKICEDLDIPVMERHTAKGDAMTVALAWLKLS